MFSNRQTSTSTAEFSALTDKLSRALIEADTVVVGAGAGLSTAAGFDYGGERFEKYFSDFREKYGIRDMYSGGFYPFETAEEYWAWWSRHILYNRYEVGTGKLYHELLSLLDGKDYFVLTTNVDHQFQLAGFDKKRLFYTQGDYGLFQCSRPCRQVTYDNEQAVRQMVAEQKNMKIPTELLPKCPVCGAPMTVNLRTDGTFVQDAGWDAAAERYSSFVRTRRGQKVLFLELGVGFNTPSIIKYPFLRMTAENENATYACVNLTDAVTAREIATRSICINADIAKTVEALLEKK